jgi:hypothetical protein
LLIGNKFLGGWLGIGGIGVFKIKHRFKLKDGMGFCVLN